MSKHKKLTTCVGCNKGLAFAAKVLMSDNDAEKKELRLCPSCKSVLIKCLEKEVS